MRRVLEEQDNLDIRQMAVTDIIADDPHESGIRKIKGVQTYSGACLLYTSIYDWPIIKQVSWLLGQVMNGIYNALSAIGIENIGVAIIVFTIIVYTLLLPLTIKQQKFTKMSAVMQPEIQKIQKRYANKKDQASMLKQQEEMNMVYDKYGLKMSSGCLPSLLQLVFLFGLYPVVQNIPEYVTKVRNVYIPLVEKIQATTGYEKIMSSLATGLVPGAESLDYTKAGNMIEVMYKFQSSTWNELVDKMPVSYTHLIREKRNRRSCAIRFTFADHF